MRTPRVGQTLYAFQTDQDRIGELKFLIATQENASFKLEDIVREVNHDRGTRYPEDNYGYIVWELRRIR